MYSGAYEANIYIILLRNKGKISILYTGILKRDIKPFSGYTRSGKGGSVNVRNWRHLANIISILCPKHNIINNGIKPGRDRQGYISWYQIKRCNINIKMS